jgi:hypothetical protein
MEIIAAFPSVPYAFSTLTNTLTGEQSGINLTVLVDPTGEFKLGHIAFRAPDHSLLLLGQLSAPSIEHIEGDHYFLQFPIDVLVEHLPNLEADTGIFWAFICQPGATSDCGPNGPATETGIFTTNYSEAGVHLNSYLLLDATFVPVPAPSSDLLLGAGCLLALVVGRIRRALQRTLAR